MTFLTYIFDNPFCRRKEYVLVVNTSFNVRGEPIIYLPENAYKRFVRFEIIANMTYELD
ncbi:MAG: hypothetical protein GY707_08790 [Desulfobacteraceae bacterium]|nr:hypothetical protein [Desulfobacteraceae bacterium]